MHKITDRMIVKASILAVLLCLIFGICFRYRYRLKEPVFVKQNAAVTAVFDNNEDRPGWYADVTFYYITGREDDRSIRSIEFLQLQEDQSGGKDEVSLTEFTETIEPRGQYLLHTLGGRLFVPSEEPLESYRLVTEGSVIYSDGSRDIAGFGNLVFEPDTRENAVAEVVSSSSSSTGKNEIVVRMKSDAALKVKEVLPPEQTSGSFHVRLNGKELEYGNEPNYGKELGEREVMRLKEGDVLKVDSQWHGENRYGDPAGLISSVVIVELEGKARQTLCFVHSVLQPAGGFIDVWKYLNQRGVF